MGRGHSRFAAMVLTFPNSAASEKPHIQTSCGRLSAFPSYWAWVASADLSRSQAGG